MLLATGTKTRRGKTNSGKSMKSGTACNKTPLYANLFGKGKRVLIMGWQPKGKENQGQMSYFTPGKDPTKVWDMHPISTQSAPLPIGR